ncbi:sugar phosphate isomerase/epimerase family protein [Planctomycetota bacterium]
MTKLKLGVDLCFADKRWPEPDAWLDIVKNKFGLKYVEFDSDFLDPFFVSEPTLSDVALEIKTLSNKYEVEIHNYFTGTMTHCVNLISHPDERMRRDGVRWCEEAIKVAAKLGARGIGGHFDTISSRDLDDPKRYQMLIDNLITTFQDLSKLAKQQGQEFILWEQMYAPSEVPYTIAQTKEFLARINDGASVPIQLVIDLGHMCCQNFPHKAEDTDPYEWLRQLGDQTLVVHLQQCNGTSSGHWPFTDEYNKAGIIEAEKVIEAINESGAKEMYLFFEIFFSLGQNDQQVLDEMAKSVEYWRKYVND